MKKLPFILSAALLLGTSVIFNTSCEGLEDDENNPIFGPEEDTPGMIKDFSVSLSYTSTDPNSIGAFDAETCSAVAYNSSAADVALCWQNSYGYMMTQPSGSEIKQLFTDNNKPYNNTNTCTIQNLGKKDINDYKDKETLSRLSVSSGTIPKLQGANQVQVEAGDVIAFKTSSGTKGVGKVSGLSKVTKNIKFSGVVYYSSASGN
ncbi:MAG: hypothetical protein MJZ61_06475 [Bacteroidales bacterium]|nr:hypothetical protein [Bacteroidales bacterium]